MHRHGEVLVEWDLLSVPILAELKLITICGIEVKTTTKLRVDSNGVSVSISCNLHLFIFFLNKILYKINIINIYTVMYIYIITIKILYKINLKK